MDIENIITELEKEQKAVAQASKNIDRLLKELRFAPFSDYDYVTVKTASEKINMSACWIYNKINNGQLKAIRKGAKTFVSAKELMAINDTMNGGIA